MTKTAPQLPRASAGLALFSIGLRPFFLAASVWAALSMLMWILMLAGQFDLPTRFDPLSWHAHEFLFGTLGAIIAGFLLTAVPNWTGRAPLTGSRLAALVCLWLAGRAAIAVSAALPAGVAATVDLAFPAVLAGVIAREIIASQNWKNLVVLVLLIAFTLANGLFHLDTLRGSFAAQGAGLRLGLSTAVMMIALIGGRIVPSFTRNWLVAQGHTARPASPMQRFDKAVLLATVATLGLWVARSDATAAGFALVLIGLLHFARLARWQGWHSLAEPLVLVLHVGYGFVPLGALAMGTAILLPEVLPAQSAQHVWMAGAIGLTTLAVMTRASLGHTGAALHAGPGTIAIYALVILSVAARWGAGLSPDLPLLEIAAACWIAAYATFAVLYGPLLLRRKQGAK